MSYKPVNNINSSSDLNETLKNQAINKGDFTCAVGVCAKRKTVY